MHARHPALHALRMRIVGAGRLKIALQDLQFLLADGALLALSAEADLARAAVHQLLEALGVFAVAELGGGVLLWWM